MLSHQPEVPSSCQFLISCSLYVLQRLLQPSEHTELLKIPINDFKILSKDFQSYWDLLGSKDLGFMYLES